MPTDPSPGAAPAAPADPAAVAALVATAVRLRGEHEGLKSAAEEAAALAQAKARELDAAKAALVALGAGKYSDGQVSCLVIAAEEGELQPDRFEVPDALHEEEARALAGEHFRQLFDRHEYFTPKVGFEGLVKLLVKPKRKAAALLDLLRVPGAIAGARKAYLRWLK